MTPGLRIDQQCLDELVAEWRRLDCPTLKETLLPDEAVARCTELFGHGVVTSGAGSCDRPGNAADTPTN